MDVSSYSFQDIFKLMNSLTAFETLLDAANLNPDICTKLGIEEQFKQLLGKVGKCVKHDNTTDLKVRCLCSLCNEEIKMPSFDIRTSLAIHNASEEHRSIVKTKELNQEQERNEPKANENNVLPLLDLNNIPQELKKSSSENSSFSQNEHIVNNLNNASATCLKCQQIFCICGFKDKPLIDLGEKLSNLLQQHRPRHTVPPTVPVPPKFGQQHVPRGRRPSPESRSNNKQQENKQRSRSHADPNSQQCININVHVSPSADKSRVAAAQPPKQQKVNKKNPAVDNLEKLRTRQLGGKEETQLMFKFVREAEGQNWRRENITKDGTEYVCNVCNTGSRINSPYDLVMHTRGKSHQETLKSIHAAKKNNPHNKTQNKINYKEQTSSPRQSDHQHSGRVIGYLNDFNMEILRNRSLDDPAELSLLFKMVEEAEGGYWQQDHISPRGNLFFCNICEIKLNSPHQVVQHVQGQSHVTELAKEKCSVM